MIPELDSRDPEIKSVCYSTSASPASEILLERLTRLSHWSSMVNVVRLLKSWVLKGSNEPHSEQLLRAERFIVKIIQADCFSAEIHALSHGNPVSENSPVSGLDPYIDSEGLIRAAGRIKNSSFPEHLKHPIILPRKSPHVKALVTQVHRELHHQVVA